MSYEDNPFLAMVAKNEKFTGDQMVVPIHYGNTNKHSQSFTVASSTNTGTSKTVKWNVTRQKVYGVAILDRETLKASEGNEGAFLNHFKFEVDDTLHAVSRQVAMQLFRSGSGSVGQISSGSTVGSDTITLATVEDAVNFEVGEEIALSDADGGGSLRSSGATAAITGIDRDLGTLTFAGNLTAEIAAAAALDYVFKSGYHDEAMKGLAAWIPSTAPTSTAFFGVDRSVDTTRLGGVRYDASATSEPVEEALIKLATRVGREGGRPNVCFLPFSKWEELAQSLQTQQRYVGGEAKVEGANVAFQSIVIVGPRGPINVIPDHNCPGNRGYMLDMSTWELASLGAAPHIFSDDGEMIRASSSDAYEVRAGCYGQLVCRAPGKNGVVLF